MRAMTLLHPAPIAEHPLELEERPAPEPGPGEIQVAVSVCGVCRTDLHLVEGDLAPVRAGIIPGHQVVGRVAALGPHARRFREGDRVGVAWIHSTCGHCDACARGSENLCRTPVFTGWHTNGGYAERVCVPEAFAYPIPHSFSDAQAAPLLCAGIIGYRALARSRVGAGERLGLYGFGSSAHITLQLAVARGCEVYVCTRGKTHQELARELGAVWAGPADEPLPVALDGAILFAPVGTLVPLALRALRPGGTLACAGIELTEVPALDYKRDLFGERSLTSVTANTRRDGEELLASAVEIPIRPRTTLFPLEQANQALEQLKASTLSGCAVLVVDAENAQNAENIENAAASVEAIEAQDPAQE